MYEKKAYSPSQWKRLIPDIERVIADMEKVPILSVGITPYTRIVPSFFLKNYSIYTIHRSSDVELMESIVPMNVLADRFPDIAKKVHGTGYLIGNFAFQNFLKSRRTMPKLLFYTLTDKIIGDLDRLNIPWIGNNPKTFEQVKFKGTFRELVKERGLSSLPSEIVPRIDFLRSEFKTVWERQGGAFVVQRADKETGGNEGTFFIHKEEDFNRCISILTTDVTGFQMVTIAPFIVGHSTSMLGCVMNDVTLSGPLQLQLIDVPQSLHGVPPDGIFFGNDIGFRDWGDDIEAEAQKIIESIGAHLREKGYRGIFGIDFLYDKKRNKIYPNECNPRFTGSLLLHSLMLLEVGVPPLEFFHLVAHLGITCHFDFNAVNKALKTIKPCSHIAFSPKGIPCMKLPLLAGIYSYNPEGPTLSYIGPGTSLHDFKNPGEFLLIDTVPRMDEPIEQNVPRLFKFIFPRSIAKSSYEIDEIAGFLVDKFARALVAAVQENKKEAS